MKARSASKLPFPVFALGVIALLSGAITIAAVKDSQAGIHLAPQVTFSTSPVWETIPGTNVSWVREQQRPNYDLFRYGSKYYIYNDGYWYRSSRLNQRFALIDERYVPVAFSGVPSDHWRSYPVGWTNPKNPHYSGRHDNGNRAGNSQGKGKGKSGKQGR